MLVVVDFAKSVIEAKDVDVNDFSDIANGSGARLLVGTKQPSSTALFESLLEIGGDVEFLEVLVAWLVDAEESVIVGGPGAI
jgi:hypothetical protein